MACRESSGHSGTGYSDDHKQLYAVGLYFDLLYDGFPFAGPQAYAGTMAEAADKGSDKTIFLYGGHFHRNSDDYDRRCLNINHTSDSCNKSVNHRSSLSLCPAA